MGIPSFYRHLCRRFPHLIKKGAGDQPEWLALDFNCAMYHVLRDYGVKKPYTVTNHKAWETGLCEAIAAYMREIVIVAHPTRGVYVSCDGVVCAAKRKQQRLRRFKGPWTSVAEANIKKSVAAPARSNVLQTESSNQTCDTQSFDSNRTCDTQRSDYHQTWDQNALTPGSAFMGQLGTVLTTAGVRLASETGLTVTVSTTDEPGEGEHKLLRHLRAVRPASCAIYGLDADLILLAMLLWADTSCQVSLLREAQEFEGSNKKGGNLHGAWRTLNITGLASVMIPSVNANKVRDFVAAMSLLGNDFLPRSLTRTVRDDGIPKLLATLNEQVWGANKTPLVGADGTVQRAGLAAIVGAWAVTEEGDMLAAAQEVHRASFQPAGIGATPEETALREWNILPSRWANLTRLLTPDRRTLIPGWRDVYKRTWHAGNPANYAAGVAWVWDYYTGRAVDQGWVHHEHLPPLWSDLHASLTTATEQTVSPPPIQYGTPLPAWVHLLSVLPASSVSRLLPPNRQRAMEEHSWYWPASWSLFDIGRTQMWECEPVIPMVPEGLLRSLK